MNMTLKTTLSTLSISIATLLLSACGGSSGGDNNTSPSAQAKGRAVDPPIFNGSVLFSGCSTPSVITDALGGFTVPAGCNNSAITVVGGVDTFTGLPFNGVIRAPAAGNRQFVTASPITTLVQNFVDAGSSETAARERVAILIGANNTDVLSADPLANKDLLVATTTAQALVTQIQTTLLQLSAKLGTGLTAQQAADAAVKGLAAQFSSAATVNDVNLTSTDFISKVVAGSVTSLSQNSTTSGSFGAVSNVASFAQNVAALTAPIIQADVVKVNTVIKTITIGANIEATLNSVSAANKAIARDASNSQKAASTASLVATLLTTSAPTPAQLAALGNAIANGTDAQITAAFNATGGASTLPAGTADNLTKVNDTAATYTSYLNLSSVSFNGSSTVYSVDQAIKAFSSTTPLVATGGRLNSVELKINKVGQPFTGNTLSAKVGLSYTINNSNTLNLVFDKVNLTFNDSGVLTGAAFAPNTSFAFNTTGAVTASNPSLTNIGIDVLTVTNGVVSLPVNTLLSKLAGKDTVFAKVVNSYAPVTGNNVAISASIIGNDSAVEVGVVTDGTAKAADTVVINSTNKSIIGRGVNTRVNVQ